ncbi:MULTISPECIES: hypothetical protein [Aerococcus]|uniref:Uncharacterized protein n=1 Tax=Aerococcus loyolae TaxID=2976809 RepID=A0ABT4C056_9LACT|nr:MULTISPECIES: hypothetical protein [Aerococcus]MCY3025892.1 hypothetical protein [Aerococcus loyolae]MCY3027743.1 hypothetical protein [Aerococcus loyolae]MCY3029648.1 hypothetical protein [Aerococcus loyolae]MDK6232481.1 hypothetical protein [Aerococcus urinae]MDK6258441.1 hypothetical protein [Aerococcus urinae]
MNKEEFNNQAENQEEVDYVKEYDKDKAEKEYQKHFTETHLNNSINEFARIQNERDERFRKIKSNWD